MRVIIKNTFPLGKEKSISLCENICVEGTWLQRSSESGTVTASRKPSPAPPELSVSGNKGSLALPSHQLIVFSRENIIWKFYTQ